MKQRIIESIKSPDHLERLYRENNQDFARAFGELSPDYDSELVRFWKVRLAPETESEGKGFLKLDLLVVIILSLITGLLVKLPDLFSQIDRQAFYMRELAILVFNGIILYTFWVNGIFDRKRILIYGVTLSVLTLYINLLPIEHPYSKESDSVTLAFIHVPLFLWCLFGLSYASFEMKNTNKWVEFIRFNRRADHHDRVNPYCWRTAYRHHASPLFGNKDEYSGIIYPLRCCVWRGSCSCCFILYHQVISQYHK